MLLFVVFLLYSFALQPLRNFSQWHAWLARPSTSVAFLVFFAALLGHMWVGLRDVLLDYAKPAGLRRGLLFGAQPGGDVGGDEHLRQTPVGPLQVARTHVEPLLHRLDEHLARVHAGGGQLLGGQA